MNPSVKRLYVANDHAALLLKPVLIAQAEAMGYEVQNLGTDSEDSVDYPDYANKLADAMQQDPDSCGLLLCGSGIGISIAANRHTHIRAALCHDARTAELAREHNDANVLVLGARLLDESVAGACLQAFLGTDFAAGRHAKRVAKLA